MQSPTQPVFETSFEMQQRRRRRVAQVLSESLSSLPRHISHLNALLSSPPVDLARVARIIHADRQFSGLLLGLASTEMFNTRSCAVTIPQAVVLFGSERLRALALAYAFMKYAANDFPNFDRRGLWQHSFLTAMLSERTAIQVAYPESGQAYLAGLLHDLGRLPLLIVAREEQAVGALPSASWDDSPPAERGCFGMDHCEVGRSIAAAWNLAPSLTDVVQHHHSPSNATHDSCLAEIIAAGDHYSNVLSPFSVTGGSENSSQKAGAVDAFVRVCVPELYEQGRPGSASVVRSDRLNGADVAQIFH